MTRYGSNVPLTDDGQAIVISPKYSPTSRNGTTSATPNSYSQVMAANPSRSKLFFQNPHSSGVVMVLAYGESGQEIDLISLTEGQAIEQGDGGVIVSRIAVKCSVASRPYYAHEG